MATAEVETTEPETVPVDAYLVSFDETWGWVINQEDAPFIRAIHSVYLVDRSQRTHCCEMTPSYFLIYMYDVVECQPGTTDDRAQRLYEKYENLGGDDCYVHCHELETIIKADEKGKVCHLGTTNVSFDDVCHDDQMEALREHYCANPPL